MSDNTSRSMTRLFLFTASVAVCLGGGMYVFHDQMSGASSTSQTPSIIVVDTAISSEKVASSQNDTVQRGFDMVNTPLPDGQTVTRRLALSLPSLKEIVTECSGASCTVSAKAAGSRNEGDQQGLEQMVSNDIPTALSQSGYTLIEPLQIEETGADETRILLRISIA
ncbi:hypothetical protein [Sphingomonas sp. Leaf37]|uniref:hypothetical protein n=1 Tax=Sphingomonas sp. Leaf37 TaxID=2876552 RepID=UPI001E3A5323|nr:hypothetical protein [Sphingomonas sp. Leaf37]